ncbi:uncharacterized protein BDR25DRAFT_329473 [Lindgomyces ingoldianus]|uniref:Uncharacterized protein n=1 Tax=Lindgomyces ingoldianus TaxID=673940 RepID=A0ACB6QBF8_9PLEO|nr:uncharacterized protein BDR25DRAFT_329473 [Lindgomyces ingoldianus]KAF2463928.1 hypothetical protein BDR25DRAFT_329473 [Lindgomyces ingoldianus]
MITHQNFASAMFYKAESYSLDRTPRIYEFSSYRFIVSIVNIFNALWLVESITSLRANIIHLTPFIAKLLSPGEIPSIRTVVFSEEGLHADDLRKRWGKVYVLNVYGQLECAPRVAIKDNATTPAEATRIRIGLGQRTWIVDPQNYNRLVLIRRGYLADPKNTTASFVEDPVWLASDPPEGRGRSGQYSLDITK